MSSDKRFLPDGPDEVVRAELTEVREELRRLDGKARDLLVVAGFAVTSMATAGALVHRIPPLIVIIGLVVAAVPWLAAVVCLLWVIRPDLSRAGGGFPDPDRLDRMAHVTVEQWCVDRWTLLSDITGRKYGVMRRAVDLLLLAFVTACLSAMVWAVLSSTQG